MSKETFKIFARSHPELATTVMRGETSWQKLYELYDIYGENNSIWDNYLSPIIRGETSSTTTMFQPNTFKDFFNTFKNIDLDSVQKGVTNLQKTVGLLQDIGLGSNPPQPSTRNTYEPRPMYRYFED